MRTDWPQVDGQEGVEADLKDSSLSTWAEVMRFPEKGERRALGKGHFIWDMLI